MPKINFILALWGLRADTKNAQSIFERNEHYLRAVTSEAYLNKIDFTSVISRSVHDVDMVSAYNSMLTDGPQWCCQRCTAQCYIIAHQSVAIYFCKGHSPKTHEIKTAEIKITCKDIGGESKECVQERQNYLNSM